MAARSAAVVSAGEDHHPAVLSRLDDHGGAEAVAHVGFGEFPEHLGSDLGLGVHVRRIGHVEGVEALATFAQSADQDRAPIRCGRACRGEGATRVVEVDVEGGGRGIDEKAVLVVRVAQLRQQSVRVGGSCFRKKETRHIGKLFLACIRASQCAVEGMDHAVVGAGVHHHRPIFPSRLEGRITRVDRIGVRQRRRAGRCHLGVHDVAQPQIAQPVSLAGIGGRAFVGAVATQPVDVVLGVVAADVAGVHQRLLLCCQAAITEGHTARGATRHDVAAGVPPGAGQLFFELRLAFPHQGCGGIAVAIEGEPAGAEKTGPVLRVVLRRVGGGAGGRYLRARERERGGVSGNLVRDPFKRLLQAGHHGVGLSGGEVVVGTGYRHGRVSRVCQRVAGGRPPVQGNGPGEGVGVEIGRQLLLVQPAELRGQVELVVPGEGLFQNVHPIGLYGLLAHQIGSNVLGIGFEGQAGHVVGRVARPRGSSCLAGAHALKKLGIVRGLDCVEHGVVLHVVRHGIRLMVCQRVARDILVAVGVDVADAQDEVALAAVLDGVRCLPVGDRRKAIQVGCLRGLAGASHGRPRRHIFQASQVPQGSVIQFVDGVDALVVARQKLAELVEVVHHAAVGNHHAVGHRFRAGIGRSVSVRFIRVAQHLAGVGGPLLLGVVARSLARLRLGRADEFLARAQHTAVAVFIAVVQIAQGAEAHLVRVLLDQPFRLPPVAVLLAVGFQAHRRIANLRAHGVVLRRGSVHRRGK
ncbi:hypothetical protein D9M72_338950 [compost metagenome]